MDKVYLSIAIIGVLFCSLGFKTMADEEQRINTIREIIGNSEISIFNKVDEVEIMIEKSKTYNKYLSLLNSIDNYNELLKVKDEIENIEYTQIKEDLLIKYKSVEENILKYTAIETLKGNISAFTPYCSDGCHGYTASGRYIGNNIYYNDKDYGKVMIVAADKSYPFGTIVRFNNLKYFGKDIYAIVLDRGGAVGKGRKVLFDLLFETEREASNFGIARKIDCDILRLGY